jgi:hypothetical protein
MRCVRASARRRRARPVRLVVAGTTGSVADETEAHAYSIGIDGARLLQTHFPDVYTTEGVAARPATLANLFACCLAFWQLAEIRAGLPLLRWPSDAYGGTDDDRAETPAETLRCINWVSEEWMAEAVSSHIYTPRPHYYGWGVESALEEWREVDDLLVLLLWHLFQHTPWSPGIDVSASDVSDTIARLRPLPADTPLHLLSLHLALPEAAATDVRPFDLLAYPFAQTSNELANHTDYEVEAIHYGELDETWSWSGLDRMIAAAREAKHLAEAFEDWSLRVKLGGEQALRQEAARIYRAARAARHEQQNAPHTLLTLVGHRLDQQPAPEVSAL